MNTPASPYGTHNGSPQQPLPHQPYQQHHTGGAVPPHQQQQQQQQQPQQPQQPFKYGSPGHGIAPLYPPMNRLMYVPPLTPPSSEPGSPGGTMQGPPRRTPPPPYPAPTPQHNPVTNTVTARISHTSVPKYNRRNNPELEKRRVHHCDFVGKLYWTDILIISLQNNIAAMDNM